MKYIVVIYSFIIFLSCTNLNKSDIASKDTQLIVLDFNKNPIRDTIHASRFVKSATPIVLETTDDNLMTSINGMQVTDNCICILDKWTAGNNNLFVFDKKGRYLRKIGQTGQGPGEYISIHDFTIDEKKDKVFLVDSDGEKIRVYQFSTGKFLQNIDFKDSQVEYGHIQYHNNKLFTDFTYYSRTEKGPMIYVLNETTGDIESSCLDIDIHNHGWLESIFKGESFFYCKNSDKPIYTQYFMDTLMVVNKDRLDPYLVIKSEDWVTDHDVRSHKNTTPDMDQDAYHKIENLPIAFNIQNYVESDRYIYFSYSKQFKWVKVLYDKNSPSLLRANRVIDDIVYNEQNSSVLLIGCGDENGMYGYVHPLALSDYYEHNVKDPYSGMKPEYKRFFEKNMQSDSNPILVYYEYKK